MNTVVKLLHGMQAMTRTFCEPEQVRDDRAIFANIACKLLYQKYNSALTSVSFQTELRILRMYFEEYVRNIYEIIHDEIPLFAYADYLKYGFDSMAWDDEDQMTEAKWKQILFDNCKKFYE